MSYVRKSVRVNDGYGTLTVTSGNTVWSRVTSVESTVTTTDATVTTLATINLDDNTTTKIDVLVTARDTGSANGAEFNLSMGYLRHSAGAPVALGTVTSSDPRSTAGAAAWAATIDTNSNTARVRVTGAISTTINWVAVVQTVKRT